jgi:hypothetical protein
VGDDQEQDVLMCREIWAFDVVALPCSALLQPLLGKNRFFAYSASSLAQQPCGKLRGQFDCLRWRQHGLNCTRLYRCTSLYIKTAASCALPVLLVFHHVFLSLNKNWRIDSSLLQRHNLDRKYGRVELFRLDCSSGWSVSREMKLLPAMASC